MSVGYCKDCSNYSRGWCSLRREDHDKWDKCTSSEGYEDKNSSEENEQYE